MALAGAIAPLGKVAGHTKNWLTEVIIYTLAGSLTSSFVGAFLGLLGEWVSTIGIGEFGLWFAIVIAVLAITRELGWVSYPIPQLKRQTKDLWARLFPRKVAAMLWGLDLGLTFTTRITFSGVLVIVTILIGKPAFGAALFALYWLGRALSLWIAPLLLPDSSSIDWVQERIYSQYQLFRRIHVFGLVIIITVVILSTWLARSVIT